MKNINLKRNVLFTVMSTVALVSSSHIQAKTKMTLAHQKASQFANEASEEVLNFFYQATALFSNSAKPKLEASANKFKIILENFKPTDAAGIAIRNMMLKSLIDFISTIKNLKRSKFKEIDIKINSTLKKMEIEFKKVIIIISKMPDTTLLVAKFNEISKNLKTAESKYNAAQKLLIARKIKIGFSLPDLSGLSSSKTEQAT